MAQKHAVLGLVIERPGYGYELAQRIDGRFPTSGWKAPGVYGALNSLEAAKLVVSDGEQTRSGIGRNMPRTVYRATDQGRSFFRDWLMESSAYSPARQELDQKIQLAEPDLLPALIEQTWAQERACIAELQRMTTLARELGVPKTWPETSALLQRNAEMRLLQVRISWLQEVREAMKRFLDLRLRNV